MALRDSFDRRPWLGALGLVLAAAAGGALLAGGLGAAGCALACAGLIGLQPRFRRLVSRARFDEDTRLVHGYQARSRGRVTRRPRPND